VRVRVRLFASLRDRIPDAERGRACLCLEDGTSLQGLLDLLRIPPHQAQMVLVDGQQAPRKRVARAATRLEEGQTISIFPPLAGG
jgi:molybdopterin converting factor small subunit